MNILLMSMPDAAPVVMHESAFHMPNLGIAGIGANLDAHHDITLVDLIRKRRHIGRYLHRLLKQIQPDVVGLSTMTWQYGTCINIIRFIRRRLPGVHIVIGGYHPTLMYDEIGQSTDAGLIDFMIRGEGESAFCRLMRALEGADELKSIPGLSYKDGNQFIHNPRGELQDLSQLKLPIRDRRRKTWGYHIMNHPVEVMETSRGCTRNCNFCSIRHMYGRKFRPFPLSRILADVDDIYFKRKRRWIFVADDNLVLAPKRVIQMCRAIVARGYRKLHFVAQADCVTIARNPDMLSWMARAGFKTIFLGIENVSAKNLQAAGKGDIVAASRRAVRLCHQHDIMVVGGMIFGFPDDTEADIVANYRFLKTTAADTAYCQILTPYPKTEIRHKLVDQGLVTHPHAYARYNGIWANVRTHHLDSDTLQYLVWYHRRQVLGWWQPSERVCRQGWLWTSLWLYLFRPLMKAWVRRAVKKRGWKGCYRREIKRLEWVNRFPELSN